MSPHTGVTSLDHSSESIMKRFSTASLYAFLRRRHFVLLLFTSIMLSACLAGWYLPYPDPPMFVYRALRADPVGYLVLKSHRWLACLENAFGLVGAPVLKIDIKTDNMQILQQKRLRALKDGLLIQGEDDFVPAVIRHEDKSVKVKLRLKGDMLDHIQDEKKWSYRIHTRNDEDLFGIRRFSLQDPGTRNFQFERLFFETVSIFDVMAPRYFLVSVIQNGEQVGLMAFEEHFSGELLAYHDRPDGVIIRFDESVYYKAVGPLSHSPDNLLLFHDYHRADIDAFRSNRVRASVKLNRDYTEAVGLLRGFVEGYLPASQVFNIEQMAGLIACAHFWRAWHGIRWGNLRFYYNRGARRLEPIAFDTDTNFHNDISELDEPIIKKMLEDPVLRTAYRQALKKLISLVEDGTLATRLREVEKTQLSLLLPDSRFVRPFNYVNFDYRAEELTAFLDQPAAAVDSSRAETEALNPSPLPVDLYPQVIQAYRINEHMPRPYLELANLLPFPVAIRDINWRDKQGFAAAWQPDTTLTMPIILPGSPPLEKPVRMYIPYKRPDNRAEDLSIKLGFQNDDRTISHTVRPYVPAWTELPPPDSVVP